MSDINEAEMSVLGAMILSPAAIDDVADIVSPGDFYRPVHETIFAAIMSMFQARLPVDEVTLSKQLGQDLDPVGGAPYLHQLSQFVPSPASAGYYAQIVADAAIVRRLHAAGLKVSQLAETGDDPAAMVEEARKTIDNVSARAGAKVDFLGDDLDAIIDRLDQDPVQVPTPWEAVNDVVGGLRPGGLYIVGARPSVGKSVIGLQLAKSLTRKGSVAFASLEMTRDEVMTRIISSDLRIDITRLLDRKLTPGDWKRIAEHRAAWQNVPLAIMDRSALTITDIRRFARSTHRRHPLAGIVVDYLQLMSAPRGDKRPRHEFVADVSRQLKILAMDMGVPIIALSQLNRNSEARMDKLPQLSDLRESGAVEQDADVVFLLHREIMGELRGNLHVLIAKNRHGRTDTANLVFWGHYSMALDEGLNPQSEKSYEITRMGKAAS